MSGDISCVLLYEQVLAYMAFSSVLVELLFDCSTSIKTRNSMFFSSPNCVVVCARDSRTISGSSENLQR